MLKYFFSIILLFLLLQAHISSAVWNRHFHEIKEAPRKHRQREMESNVFSTAFIQAPNCYNLEDAGRLLAPGGMGEGLSSSTWEDHTESASDCDELRRQFSIKHGHQPRTCSVWSARKSQILLSQGSVSFLTKDVELP